MGRLSKKLAKKQKHIEGVTYDKGCVKVTPAKFEELKASIRDEVVADAMYKTFTCACAVIWNHFGMLSKKEVRMKNFYDLYKQYLETCDYPTVKMLEAEKALFKQTGLQILRDEGVERCGEGNS